MSGLPLSHRGAVLLFVGLLACATAPAAHADDTSFLELLKTDQALATFSPSVLLQAGQNICKAKNQGDLSEEQAISMVENELGLPTDASDAAIDIVAAASAALDCSPPGVAPAAVVTSR